MRRYIHLSSFSHVVRGPRDFAAENYVTSCLEKYSKLRNFMKFEKFYSFSIFIILSKNKLR